MGAALSATNKVLRANFREPAGEPEGALVLFHGRGADEDDLFPLLDALDPGRRLLGVTPRAPLSLPPGGAHWYAIREVGFPDPSTFWSGFEQATAFVDSLGFPSDRVVLGGFSQGAVMSYALSLAQGRRRPAAVIALSGFMPTVDGLEYDLAPPLPPIAIAHGSYDPVITVEFSRRARTVLEAAGADVLYHEAPLPHTIDPRFVLRLREWLSGRIEAASTERDRAASRSARSTT